MPENTIPAENNQKELKSEKIYPGTKGLRLSYEDEGVFLFVKKPESGLDIMKIIAYLKRKEIQGADMGLISRLLSGGEAQHERIADAQHEIVLEEEVQVEVVNHNLEAYITVNPPDRGGRMFTKERLLHELSLYHNITDGILDEAIDGFIENRNYGERIQVAQGIPPKHGEDAVITYHFDFDDKPKYAASTDGANSKVDFREVNTFRKVSKGEALITRSMPTRGEPGEDVHGKLIPAKPGRDKPLPGGKNLMLSPDKRSMLAGMEGRLELGGDGKFAVSPSVKVDGDVDMSVGNIDFEGDVEVMGNVNTGFKIKAGGDVTIHGMAECCEIECGGNLVVQNGMSGADKGTLKAGGKIYVRYVERATLNAGTDIDAEFTLHSNLRCEGHINVLEGKGSIIGGAASAGTYIVAKTIGAEGSPTLVELAISPEKQERMAVIDAQLKDIEEKERKLRQQIKKGSTALYTLPESQINALNGQMETIKKIKESLETELQELNEAMKAVWKGQIYVQDRIYAGVKIGIGKSLMPVRTEQRHVTFVRDKTDIVMKPYAFVDREEKDR